MKEIRIPIDGYGWGAEDYGLGLECALANLKFGVDYVARLEKGPPSNIDEDEKQDWSLDSIDLVLRPKP